MQYSAVKYSEVPFSTVQSYGEALWPNCLAGQNGRNYPDTARSASGKPLNAASRSSSIHLAHVSCGESYPLGAQCTATVQYTVYSTVYSVQYTVLYSVQHCSLYSVPAPQSKMLASGGSYWPAGRFVSRPA